MARWGRRCLQAAAVLPLCAAFFSPVPRAIPLPGSAGSCALVCLARKKVKSSAAAPGSGLRPCRDVIERILWDPALDADDFSFGFKDRFDGVREAAVAAPNENVKGQQRMLVKALPEHRIEYVKFRERVVWHKDSRVDLVFGTGSGGDAAGDGGNPVKIETVMATYDEWLAARDARRRRRQLGVTVAVERQVATAAGRGLELWAALQCFAPIITTVPVCARGGTTGGALEAAGLSDGPGGLDGGGLVAGAGTGEAGTRRRAAGVRADEDGRWAALGDGGEWDGNGQEEGVPLLIHHSMEAKEAWERNGGIFIHFQQDSVVEDVVNRVQGVVEEQRAQRAERRSREDELRAEFLRRLADR